MDAWDEIHERELLPAAKCASLITDAEASGGFRLRGEYSGTETYDLDATALVPQRWTTDLILPLLQKMFGVRTVACVDAPLRIVKYVAGGRTSGIGLHSDGSELSFVCALNDDFEGGGTYFRKDGRIYLPPTGSALIFCGRWVHSGVMATRGVRYVLTGFFTIDGTVEKHARVEAIREQEEKASYAMRECPNGCFLTREFDGFFCGSTPQSCSRCGVAVRVRHQCCARGTGWCDCGTSWCGQCLEATRTAARRSSSVVLGGDAGRLPGSFVADLTLNDGSKVSAGERLLKVWRIGYEGDEEEDVVSVEDTAFIELRRDDIDSDERIGSRITTTQPHHRVNADGTIDISCEIFCPMVPGPYRVYFRLVDKRSGLSYGERLWADFTVADDLHPRIDIARSWEEEKAACDNKSIPTTLVIAFAGADAMMGSDDDNNDPPGGVASFEFVNSLRKAGVGHALFLRCTQRCWYLRGLDITAPTFECLMDNLRGEIAKLPPSTRVVTIGSSMGGYAAVRAAIELRAHQAIAFAPQVILEPSERKALHLPHASYDIPLEGLSALGRVEGFTLSSLVDIANAAAASDHSTTLEVHVGEQSPGDLTEAKLLQQAVSTLPAQLGLSCSVSVHDGCDHMNVAKTLRDSGELHELLLSATGRGCENPAIPEGFVGFVDCADF